MGDLYRALGQGDQARDAYLKSLAIAERLAQAEPDRADYQRDLSVSYEQDGRPLRAPSVRATRRGTPTSSPSRSESVWPRPSPTAPITSVTSPSPTNEMGDLYRALGQGDQARDAYLKSLAIAERLAQAEPDRADYQRDLSVSYNKMGDLYRALGQGDQARDAYLKSLAIAERLAQAEPDRADYQVDLGELPDQSRHCRRFVRTRAHRAGARDPPDAPGSRTTRTDHESTIAELRELLRVGGIQ